MLLFGFVEVRGSEIPVEKLRDCIASRCAEAFGTIWDKHFGRLQAFKEIMGHCSVKKGDYEEWVKLAGDDPPLKVQFRRDSLAELARWVGAQRRLKRRNRLSEQRIRLLNGLDFAWSSDEAKRHREEAAWNRRLVSISAVAKKIEAIPDESCENPAEAIIKEEELDILIKAIYLLDFRQRRVICARFGIGQERVETVQALAADFALSNRCIRRVEKESLRELRFKLNALMGPISDIVGRSAASRIYRELQALRQPVIIPEEEARL